MTIEKNDSHITEALANRIEQFKGKENFADLIRIYVQQVQDLEDALFEVLLDTTLESSVGEHLDNIGALVGEPRRDREDEMQVY